MYMQLDVQLTYALNYLSLALQLNFHRLQIKTHSMYIKIFNSTNKLISLCTGAIITLLRSRIEYQVHSNTITGEDFN